MVNTSATGSVAEGKVGNQKRVLGAQSPLPGFSEKYLANFPVSRS